MDVHCSSCGEPWDTHHLWQDAIYDTSLGEEEIAHWLGLPAEKRLAAPFRARFEEAGWEFGESLLHVRRCPGCAEHAQLDADRDAAKAAICDLLGDDEDGIAVEFEDLGL